MIEKKGRRRDPRYIIKRGQARIEFDGPHRSHGRMRGSIGELSVAGLAFELENAAFVPEVGFLLGNATICVGYCVLRGDVAIRNVRPDSTAVTRFGGLFYPDSPECEDRLMSLLAGLAATA